MKILVLANDEQKEELLVYPAQEDVNIIWATDPPATQGLLPLDACIDLLFENTKERREWLAQLKAPLIIVNSVIFPLDELGEGFIRINGWNSFIKKAIIEAATKSESLKKAAEQLFSKLGRKTEWVPDIPGFITARIVAAIINEAFLALEENVSVEKEIDTAMKLGTNYPYGPFEWGEKIGLTNVYSLLERLNKEQTRYNPSGLMKKKILV